ncbi:MAG: hypothetical protein HZB53_01170 [Chloroflexi bacterium]|nr:hypothetical protein [Chloroflexota bacterium]
MGSRLLKPRPMVAIEPCATCGREHADTRDYRRCAVCGRAFCWMGDPRGENVLGVERRACGARRDHTTEYDDRRRSEYRCRQHISRSWALFGADWRAVRPLATTIFLAVAFSITFWGFIFYVVSAWLRSRGIG